jgi:hypothetical protein
VIATTIWRSKVTKMRYWKLPGLQITSSLFQACLRFYFAAQEDNELSQNHYGVVKHTGKYIVRVLIRQ